MNIMHLAYRPDIAVVVLANESTNHWQSWIQCLRQQTLRPGKCLVLGLGASEKTLQLADVAGFEVYRLGQQQAHRAAAYQVGLELCTDAKYIIYIDQEAFLEDKTALEKLVVDFADPETAVVYGRQRAHEGTHVLKQYAAQFFYPLKSRCYKLNDIRQRGFTDISVSNVFAAWRVEALRSIGGFSTNVIVNADRYTAGRLLLSGWQVAYCAESQVRFANARSSWNSFRRAFDTGVFNSTDGRLLGVVAPNEGKGWRCLFAELEQLWIYEPVLIPYALFHAMIKYSGYRLGRLHRYLPKAMCRFFSTQKNYWYNATKQKWQTRGQTANALTTSRYTIEPVAKQNALAGTENWQTNWMSDLYFPMRVKSSQSYKNKRATPASAIKTP